MGRGSGQEATKQSELNPWPGGSSGLQHQLCSAPTGPLGALGPCFLQVKMTGIYHYLIFFNFNCCMRQNPICYKLKLYKANPHTSVLSLCLSHSFSLPIYLYLYLSLSISISLGTSVSISIKVGVSLPHALGRFETIVGVLKLFSFLLHPTPSFLYRLHQPVLTSYISFL